jgi:hypothetical protein
MGLSPTRTTPAVSLIGTLQPTPISCCSILPSSVHSSTLLIHMLKTNESMDSFTMRTIRILHTKVLLLHHSLTTELSNAQPLNILSPPAAQKPYATYGQPSHVYSPNQHLLNASQRFTGTLPTIDLSM